MKTHDFLFIISMSLVTLLSLVELHYWKARCEPHYPLAPVGVTMTTLNSIPTTTNESGNF